MKQESETEMLKEYAEQEYKYGFTTDVDQTKFDPGLDEEVICLLYTSDAADE